MDSILPYIEHQRIEDRCDEIVRTLGIREDCNVIFIEQGSRRFALALVSKMRHEAILVPVRIHTYAGTSPACAPVLGDGDRAKLGRVDYRKPTILVDDICDTGRTLCYLQSLLPDTVITVVLLDKPDNHTCAVRLDHAGFEVPGNMFFVGYGMDFNEYYRDLDYVGILPRRSRA